MKFSSVQFRAEDLRPVLNMTEIYGNRWNIGWRLGLSEDILIFLKRIFYIDTVNWDSIRGGIAVYFLLGIFWTFLYRLLLLIDPGAISFVNPNYTAADILYFSFTTLTTLGYGDNLPTSHYAHNLTILESALGQIFLTVLVARLVGMHLAQQQIKK